MKLTIEKPFSSFLDMHQMIFLQGPNIDPFIISSKSEIGATTKQTRAL